MALSASQGPACAFYSLEIMMTSNQAPGIAKVRGSVDTEMGPEGPGSPHPPGVRTHPKDAPPTPHLSPRQPLPLAQHFLLDLQQLSRKPWPLWPSPTLTSWKDGLVSGVTSFKGSHAATQARIAPRTCWPQRLGVPVRIAYKSVVKDPDSIMPFDRQLIDTPHHRSVPDTCGH